MAIKLYDLAGAEDDRRFSPYCWRVKMALMHKGLAFETLPWRFTEKDAIAFANSTTVPVLVDGNHTVSDSWKIAAYLEQAYPSRPAVFGGSDSQALTYFFSHWAVRTLHPPLMRAIVLDLYGHVHEKDKAYFRESRTKRYGMPLEQYGADPGKGVADFRAALEPLRPVLAENDFLSGKGPGFADYILLGVFQWARCASPRQLLEPGDPLYAWRGRVLELWGGYARKAKGYPV
ncbi:MAG: glutathione S-transferase family protein [Betaproteobacteria bacterium]|nr:MAG: glutathione S-transferase family protein [Betaproteobacteria bacterium]